jgi:hypothetical protein
MGELASAGALDPSKRGEQNAKASAAPKRKRNAFVRFVLGVGAAFAEIGGDIWEGVRPAAPWAMCVAIMAAGAFSWGSAGWAANIGDPDGRVWVNWASWSAQIQGADAREAWDKTLTDKDAGQWRSARSPALSDAGVPQASLDACFEAKECFRLRGSWRQAMASALSLGSTRPIFEAVPGAGNAPPPAAMRSIENSESALEAGKGWLPALWALFGAFATLSMAACFWIPAIEAIEFDPDGPKKIPMAVALASGGVATVVIVAMGVAAPLAITAVSEAIEWAAPAWAKGDQGLWATYWAGDPTIATVQTGRAPLPQTLEWRETNRWGIADLFVAPADRANPRDINDAEKQKGVANCQRMRLCAPMAQSALGDALREATGQEPANLLRLAPGQRVEPEWTERAKIAKRIEAQNFLFCLADWFLLISFLGGGIWAAHSYEFAACWARAMRAWAQEGELLLEREKLSAAAARAARMSRAKRRMRREDATIAVATTPAAKKKPARL